MGAPKRAFIGLGLELGGRVRLFKFELKTIQMELEQASLLPVHFSETLAEALVQIREVSPCRPHWLFCFLLVCNSKVADDDR